ncbi:MAG TPA: trypsin-like peptidase domain-containing protein [Nitrospiraceae bacterium]|nr:trypsin-like peptidase domain-containing protein [Nitrospiraceae bacterium]
MFPAVPVNMVIRKLFPILLACGILWTSGPCFGRAEGSEPDEEHTVSLYQRLAPATVFLSSSYLSEHPLVTPPSTGVGAGFILDEAGTVLTNAHVVEGASAIMATLYDGQRVKAELIGIDPYTDVAVVRLVQVKGRLATVQLGDSDHIRIGQQVLVLGSPFGLGFTLTTGIISGLAPLPGAVKLSESRLIQTTAPINPGNSGGPMVDSEGRVIGITTAVLAGAQNIGFAIPINTATVVLSELKQKGRVTRPWLGVGGKFTTEELRLLFALPLAPGLLLEDVEDGSPAAEAGLRAGTLHMVVEGVPWILGGDIIVAIQGESIRSPQVFSDIIQTLHVGQRVQIEFLRDGERYRMSLVLRDRPTGLAKTIDAPGTRINGVLPDGLLGMAQACCIRF